MPIHSGISSFYNIYEIYSRNDTFYENSEIYQFRNQQHPRFGAKIMATQEKKIIKKIFLLSPGLIQYFP